MLRAELEEEHNPRPGIESELVERLAVLMWRMRRIPVFEAALIELRREADRFQQANGQRFQILLKTRRGKKRLTRTPPSPSKTANRRLERCSDTKRHS